MPVIVVPRSDATCEMETFITVLSSTITNCETARMTITSQFFMAGAYRRTGSHGWSAVRIG